MFAGIKMAFKLQYLAGGVRKKERKDTGCEFLFSRVTSASCLVR